MAQAIIISDHQVLNDIYSLNLKVYVDTNTTVKKDPEEAFKLLELNPDIDLIITLSVVKGVDCGMRIVEFLEKSSQKIPVIIIGEKSTAKNLENIITMPANLNVQDFVQTVAKILGVSARDMVAKVVPDYYPIPIRLFKNIKKSPCDIFYNTKKNPLANEFLKVSISGEDFAPKVDGYIAKKIEYLHVPSDHRLEFVNLVSQSILTKLVQPNLSITEELEVVEEGFDIVASELMSGTRATDRVVEISKRCVGKINEIVQDIPKIKSLLLNMLNNKSGFLYMHSIVAAYVAGHIIRNISWGAEEHVEKVSFVLYFHDMFLGPIYNRYPQFQNEEELIFNDILEDKEKDIVLNHARLASEMLKSFPKCPMGADAILLQHHGRTNGVGFAIEYKDDISPLAKVIIVAEEFTSELLKLKDEGFKTPSRNFILVKLRDKFSRHTYKKIIDTLESLEC